MKKERFFSIMLAVVAILLLLNLLSYHNLLSFAPSTQAEERFHRVEQKNPQNVGFRGNGIGLACSSDGKYVYAAGSRNIFRSTDFGKAGTWEMVLSE